MVNLVFNIDSFIVAFLQLLVMSDNSLADGQVAIREQQHLMVQSDTRRLCLGLL